MSGFGLNDPDVSFPLQMLVDLFTGQLGDRQDQEKYSRIVRVIVAGNSIGRSSKDFFAKVCYILYMNCLDKKMFFVINMYFY